MTKILAIAQVTLREAIRQKLAVNLLVFGVVLIGASLVLSELTFGEQYRIILDIGLGAAEVFGTLIAVFLGAGLISRDIERRTLFPIIAKPVSRAQYVVGRYVGLFVTTTLNLLIMALALVLTIAFYLRGFAFIYETPILAGILTMALQFAIVGALAVLFSSFSTATLSAIFALSLTVSGHFVSDIIRHWEAKSAASAVLAKGLYYALPNLEALNLKEWVVYNDPVTLPFLAQTVGYGLLYAAAVVTLASVIFSLRDLK